MFFREICSFHPKKVVDFLTQILLYHLVELADEALE